jgi:tripartite-type tricarboxylate transporter receptor subunit TctC
VVAPPGTPKGIVEAYQKAITGVLSQPEVKRKFADLGVDPDVVSLNQTSAYLRSETERWGKVIRDAKVTAD